MKHLEITGCGQCRWLINIMPSENSLPSFECGRTGLPIIHESEANFPETCPLPDKADPQRLGEAIQNIWENGNLRAGMETIMELAWGKEKALEIMLSLEADRGVVTRNHDDLIYYIKLSNEIHSRIDALDAKGPDRTKAEYHQWRALIDFKKFMDSVISGYTAWSYQI